MYTILWVISCPEICSSIVSGREFDATVPEFTSDSEVKLYRFIWGGILITKVIKRPVGVFFMNTDIFGIDGTAGLQLIEISILDGRVEDMIRSR